jgi:hypothetical protein
LDGKAAARQTDPKRASSSSISISSKRSIHQVVAQEQQQQQQQQPEGKVHEQGMEKVANVFVNCIAKMSDLMQGQTQTLCPGS